MSNANRQDGVEGARPLRREHGLQPPLHPLQLTGWLVFAVLTAGTYLLLVPAQAPPLQPPLLAALSTLLLLHVVSHLAAALIDPAEPALRRLRPAPLPPLDRTKHAHVIEGGRCNLCNVESSNSRTKHCSACNKCVENFDHHCKWLNHCVGARNYRAFLMCVSTAVGATAFVAALCATEVVLYKSGSAHNSTETPPTTTTTTTSTSSDAAFLTVVAVLGLLATVTAALLLHLCFFHVYISFLGLTTYEYIRQQRQLPSTSPAQRNVPPPETETPRIESPSFQNRPVDLLCERRTQKSSVIRDKFTAVFTCAVLEETCDSASTPTPTNQDACTNCINQSNSVAPEVPPIAPPPRKVTKRRWNCCVSVPDSPDDPNSPTEPRCLIGLCRYKKIRAAKPLPHGHWSSAKIRVLFRVLSNLRRNRQRGGAPPPSPPIQTVSNIVPASCPAQFSPPRRRVVSDYELADALALLQQQQQQQMRRPSMQQRRRRRQTAHRPKSPALSPIRESGFSNPASPSRQSCNAGACTPRPF